MRNYVVRSFECMWYVFAVCILPISVFRTSQITCALFKINIRENGKSTQILPYVRNGDWLFSFCKCTPSLPLQLTTFHCEWKLASFWRAFPGININIFSTFSLFSAYESSFFFVPTVVCVWKIKQKRNYKIPLMMYRAVHLMDVSAMRWYCLS